MKLSESTIWMRLLSSVAMVTGIVLMVSLFLPGCEKASHNGDLDGQWQVMEVLHGDDPVSRPEDQRYYYDFYLSTFQLGYTDMRPAMLVGNMVYEGSRLSLDLPYVEAGRVKPEWIKRLLFWGMPSDGKAVMEIRELTSERLVMQHDSVTIICRKF